MPSDPGAVASGKAYPGRFASSRRLGDQSRPPPRVPRAAEEGGGGA
ncbi:MAG TPA: hypothetical protein VFB63_24905 [Bryobacteraceae bacterium]|nr:hypothetical protein [Bryobacteraceae bacterium]